MRKITLAALLTGLLGGGSAGALEFDETWFFGDSLTDSGAFVGNPDAGDGGRFTTNPGPVWSEVFAPRVGGSARANNPDNPRTDPLGTNYAQGGARVADLPGVGQTPSPQNARPIVWQVDTYLARSGGGADEDALYTLWGGANDLFFNIGLVGAGLITPDLAAADMVRVAGLLEGQAARLRQAGARYLMMPLLPDVGAVPAWVLEVVNQASGGNPAALAAAATVLALGGTDPAQVRLDALAAAEAVMGVPAGTLTPTYLGTVALATGLSDAFNRALLQQVQESGGNVILLDTWTLFREISSDPAAFGLLNVTGTACTTPSSLYCTTATLVDPLAPQFFLYADGVHPTTAGHRIFADYAYSVVMAPALVAGLADAALAGRRGHQELLLQRMAAGFGEGWTAFVAGGLAWRDLDNGAAGAETDEARLLAGLARRWNAAWVLGGALEVARSDGTFGDDLGNFDLDTVELSLFADYRKGAGFFRLIGSLALSAELDDVTRVVRLGGGVREERGETSADLWGVRLLAGYDLWRTGTLTLGPFGGIDWQSVEVDGYREAGSRSTAMNFTGQELDSLLLEAGLFGRYDDGGVQVHGALSFQQELEDDGRKVGAGLNSLPGTRFHLYDIETPDHYWKLELAAEKEVAPGVFLGLGYLGRLGDGDAGGHQVHAGVNLAL